jgi:hypothetical protein
MARLNISIPDALHARLDRVRERVNVSRVCADALEKEIDMLEARPSIADPTVAQLMQRLKGAREQWYERGHEDGKQWGVERATRDNLVTVAEELARCDGRKLAVSLKDPVGYEEPELPLLPGFPGGLHALRERKKVWLLRDFGLEREPARGDPEYAPFNAAFDKADDGAYLEGWRDALLELWRAVKPALR